MLLEEARWVEDRINDGTYADRYKDRLNNSVYKPLIEKTVEASARAYGNVV